MLILTRHDVEPCGVHLSGALPTIGIVHQNKPFYFESFSPLDQAGSIAVFRSRLEKPKVPGEISLLLAESRGHKLCVHQPGLEMLSYKDGLAGLCEQMRRSIPVLDRRWGIRTFKKCFIGSEAISWIENAIYLSRSEALQLGQACLQLGLFSHVLSEQAFADDYYFYRFCQDGPPDR